MSSAEWSTYQGSIREDIEDGVEAIKQGISPMAVRGQKAAVEFLRILDDRVGDVLQEQGENGVRGFLQAMEKGLDKIRAAYGVEHPKWEELASITSVRLKDDDGYVSATEWSRQMESLRPSGRIDYIGESGAVYVNGVLLGHAVGPIGLAIETADRGEPVNMMPTSATPPATD